MRESIYTIPISEVFEPMSGCPVCRLCETLEHRWVEYITGAAMMEPDVRILTNARGFCGRHLESMLALRNRLSVALLLQSRLEAAISELGAPQKRQVPFNRRTPPTTEIGCFVCDRIDQELWRIATNIVAVWVRDEDFRALFDKQEYLCLPHARVLCKAARQSARGKARADFCAHAELLCRRGLVAAKENIDAFCMLFDHRNAGSPQPPEHVTTAIEAASRVLGCDPEGGKGE